MTLQKLITSVTDPIMKANGFKRKSLAYYRIKDDILQGVLLYPHKFGDGAKYKAPRRIYSLEVKSAVAPYWIFPSGDYPRNIGLSHSAFCSLTVCQYLDDDQSVTDGITDCMGVFGEQVLPILDTIVDWNSYFDFFTMDPPAIIGSKNLGSIDDPHNAILSNIAHSRIVGYPLRHDFLKLYQSYQSGEDWKDAKPRHLEYLNLVIDRYTEQSLEEVLATFSPQYAVIAREDYYRRQERAASFRRMVEADTWDPFVEYMDYAKRKGQEDLKKYLNITM